MSEKTMSLDEMYAVGELDMVLSKVKEFVRAKTYNKEFLGFDIEDINQEVLISVFKSLDKYDNSKASLSTFVYILIDNKIKELIRKACTYKNISRCNTSGLTDGTAVDSDERDTPTYVCGSLDNGFENVDFKIDFTYNMGLDDREKQIFTLRTYGYSFVEISKMLGLTKGRVSQIWKGIVKKYENL